MCGEAAPAAPSPEPTVLRSTPPITDQVRYVTDTRPAATPERPRSGSTRKKSMPARLALFYRQVVAELRKVIWPNRKELVTYTIVVLIFVTFMIALVSLFDFASSKAVLKIFG
jgi:preprotein translocase subunit SecE